MTVYWRTWYICIACQSRDTLHGLQPGMFCSQRFGHLLPLWDKITILCLGWEFLDYYHHLFRCWTCECLCAHISDRLQGALLFGAVACCSEVTHRTAALTLSASLSCRVLLGGFLLLLWNQLPLARTGPGLFLEGSADSSPSQKWIHPAAASFSPHLQYICGCDNAKTAGFVNGARNDFVGILENWHLFLWGANKGVSGPVSSQRSCFYELGPGLCEQIIFAFRFCWGFWVNLWVACLFKLSPD